jgi:hypothetical protein
MAECHRLQKHWPSLLGHVAASTWWYEVGSAQNEKVNMENRGKVRPSSDYHLTFGQLWQTGS